MTRLIIVLYKLSTQQFSNTILSSLIIINNSKSIDCSLLYMKVYYYIPFQTACVVRCCFMNIDHKNIKILFLYSIFIVFSCRIIHAKRVQATAVVFSQDNVEL